MKKNTQEVNGMTDKQFIKYLKTLEMLFEEMETKEEILEALNQIINEETKKPERRTT